MEFRSREGNEPIIAMTLSGVSDIQGHFTKIKALFHIQFDKGIDGEDHQRPRTIFGTKLMKNRFSKMAGNFMQISIQDQERWTRNNGTSE